MPLTPPAPIARQASTTAFRPAKRPMQAYAGANAARRIPGSRSLATVIATSVVAGLTLLLWVSAAGATALVITGNLG